TAAYSISAVPAERSASVRISVSHSADMFSHPASTEIYTLSLHDALPIYSGSSLLIAYRMMDGSVIPALIRTIVPTGSRRSARTRSEEHTSELQSRENLVCRLLLEKKKKYHVHSSTKPTILPFATDAT